MKDFERFFKNRGTDTGDAAKNDMPEIVGDTGKLRTFEPTGESEDALGPIEEPSAEELLAEYNKKQREGINKTK